MSDDELTQTNGVEESLEELVRSILLYDVTDFSSVTVPADGRIRVDAVYATTKGFVIFYQ